MHTQVLIFGGTNDVGWGKDPESIFQGLLRMYTVS